jgi:mannosyltransferase
MPDKGRRIATLTARLSLAGGGLLSLTGFVVPSSTLVTSLRVTPGDGPEQLLLGATLFKIGLALLGLLIIALGRMSIWRSNSRPQSPPADPDRTIHLASLTAILVAATALRLYGLDVGLWHDEILTYVRYAQMPFGEIISTYNDQNQHLLYTLLAHASLRIFGEGAWSLRVPAVLFGIGSLWALYFFGRQVVRVREALLASALLAFSYHHIWFSQNARGYTGLLFWTLLASGLFLRGLSHRWPQFWLLYAASAALGIYTNMTMLFVIIGHFIIYLMAVLVRRKEIWPDKWAGLVLGFCLAGFLTLQLHALVLPQIFSGVIGEESTIPAWTSPIWTLLEFAKGMEMSFAGGTAAAAALVIFSAGLLSFARTNPLVMQLFIIPPVICAAVVLGMGHHLWPRFFFFTIGFGALVVVRGGMELGRLGTRLLRAASAKSLPVGTALCIGLILIAATSIPQAYAPKQDYQGALEFIEAEKAAGDAIVIVGLAAFTYKNFYKMDWQEVNLLEDLTAIRSRAKRTWLLYTFPPHMQSVYQEIMASIQRDFIVLRQFHGTVGSGTIFVCLSDTPASRPAVVGAR